MKSVVSIFAISVSLNFFLNSSVYGSHEPRQDEPVISGNPTKQTLTSYGLAPSLNGAVGTKPASQDPLSPSLQEAARVLHGLGNIFTFERPSGESSVSNPKKRAIYRFVIPTTCPELPTDTSKYLLYRARSEFLSYILDQCGFGEMIYMLAAEKHNLKKNGYICNLSSAPLSFTPRLMNLVRENLLEGGLLKQEYAEKLNDSEKNILLDLLHNSRGLYTGEKAPLIPENFPEMPIETSGENLSKYRLNVLKYCLNACGFKKVVADIGAQQRRNIDSNIPLPGKNSSCLKHFYTELRIFTKETLMENRRLKEMYLGRLSENEKEILESIMNRSSILGKRKETMEHPDAAPAKRRKTENSINYSSPVLHLDAEMDLEVEAPIFRSHPQPETLPIHKELLRQVRGSYKSFKIEGREFKLINVSGKNNNCFFNALGVNRSEQVDLLLNNITNPTIKAMLRNGMEVNNFTGEIAKFVYNNVGTGAMIQFNELRELLEQGGQTTSAIDPKQYTEIDAIAKLNNLGLRIYRPKINTQDLLLVHEYIPENATSVAFLYHEGIHFQKLILRDTAPASNREIDENVSEDGTSTPIKKNSSRQQKPFIPPIKLPTEPLVKKGHLRSDYRANVMVFCLEKCGFPEDVLRIALERRETKKKSSIITFSLHSKSESFSCALSKLAKEKLLENGQLRSDVISKLSKEEIRAFSNVLSTASDPQVKKIGSLLLSLVDQVVPAVD